MSKIIILPSEIRNKIAAGEVVERPASVVKELIENALDAQASSIHIEIKKSGKEYIKVKDNGVGMSAGDLELAILPHATSKLSSLEDLYRIQSLGFRGEALSSIASVSFLKITSRGESENIASYIQAEGGRIKNKGKVQHPRGCSVEVSNLFFNTPVRRKFLKSDQREYMHILETVIKFGIAFPEIELSLQSQKRNILDLRKSSWEERIIQLFPELKGQLIEIGNQTPLFKLSAFLSRPQINYPRRIKQFTFVNRRAVVSGFLYHIIDKAYQGLIEGRNYPAVFLFLDINPELIDVNVHPTKREIRFRREKDVYELLLGILREELQGDKVLTTFSPRTEFNEGLVDKERGCEIAEMGITGLEIAEAGQRLLEAQREFEYLVYKNRYIIWIDEEGINIVDQHAGGEKILYEKYTQVLRENKLETQRLLLPPVINLNMREANILRENLEIFNRLGFDIEEFGENSFIVHSSPVFLKEDTLRVISQVLSELIAQGEVEDKLHKVLSSLACHSAVKSGDKLSPPEIEKLIKEVKALETPYCPHGRPALVRIKWSEIEREFKRK